MLRLFTACCLLWSACGNTNTPLDAASRNAIDSIYNVEVKLVSAELDTLCQQRRRSELPLIVDSIKQKRQREIEERLKSIPQ